MRSVIQLASVNDYVGYMVFMNKQGYKWADGTPLLPVSLARYHKYGHGTYVREFHDKKEIRWCPNNYVELTPGTEVIPYIENTKYFDTYESIKSDLPSEKENKVINRKDDIYHPNHYTSGGIEPIQYIQSHNMNYEKGNVIKYITRAGKKEGESEIKDLKKAQNYIQLLITKLEEEEK
ncbi:TPA_asm: DUF3310 domain-containing protein [Listeria monocytogenes]|nr:DUF3310 domain-containing protein [Listeria monocytogenes]